jgi:radical SAM protein with 4Fe4S-binding SPASM domain
MEGEPMMNPHLFEMIGATSRTAFKSLSTNLTLMRQSHLDGLFRSGLDWISVSLDGFRQEVYEKYRVGGRVAGVLNGIAMIMERRTAAGRTTPFVQVNMIDFFHIDQQDRRNLQEFCERHDVDEFRVRPDQFGLMGPYNPRIQQQAPSKCHWPWLSMSVDCDGSVYACPIAFEQRISYGNLTECSLDEIWNNDLYVATRAYLANRTSSSDDKKLPCYDCRWYGRKPATDPVALRKQWLDASR